MRHLHAEGRWSHVHVPLPPCAAHPNAANCGYDRRGFRWEPLIGNERFSQHTELLEEKE